MLPVKNMRKRNFTTTRNPRNPETKLYKALTRVLSGPVMRRRQQVPHKLKGYQLAKYRFKSLSGQEFKREQYNPFSDLSTNYMQNQNRLERYSEFDQMEFDPILSSALDIYADEMTTCSTLEPLLQVHCSNEEIKTVLETLYYDILNADYNLFYWARHMCKYGDFFLYLDVDENIGVKSVIGLPGAEIERIEGADPTNPEYVQFQWNMGSITFENWQVSHFRILGNDKYAPYGSSVLEGARRVWRQLMLLEDAVMAYRITRSPERRVFKIDVGNIPPEDVEQYIQKAITNLKRNQVIDPDTGRVDLRYNPLSIEEDYFVPIRGAGDNTTIETLAGGQYTGDIDDVQYIKDKLFAAIKIPQSYLMRGEGAEEDKATLAQKDIRFARTIQRLQRSIVTELQKIGLIHLFVLGYRSQDLLSFEISLNNPSKISELQELDYWKQKLDVAGAAVGLDGFFSKRFIAKKFFGMSEEEYNRQLLQMFFDKKFSNMLESNSQQLSSLEGAFSSQGIDDQIGGGDMFGGDMFGGDMFGGEPGDMDLGGAGMEDLFSDEPEEKGGVEAEDTSLLVTPEEGEGIQPRMADPAVPYETPGSKGKKYTRTRNDNRRAAANRKSMMSAGGQDFGTLFKGITNLREDKDKTIYDDREITNKELQDVIDNLGSTGRFNKEGNNDEV